MQNALLIFTKNPEKGKVKTRLAATVGDDRALAIYKELLRHTRDIARQIDADRLLFYSQAIREDEWQTDHFIKYVQQGDDLGARMANAFQTALEKHHKAVIIGSDCASLTPEIVRQAFQALDTHDFVIGPALDGGYYLLGMRHFHPEVFADIEWSTETVCEETLQKIKTLGKSCQQLSTLSDIDYEEDWEKYGWDF